MHDFQVDPVSGEVKCKKCGDLDDEMQLVNKCEELMDIEQEKKDLFESSQVSFE